MKIRELLKAINEQFETFDKALASTLIMKFSSLRLTNIKGVCDYIANEGYSGSIEDFRR